MDKIASRYASALFDLALDQSIDEELLNHIKVIQSLLEDNPGFIALLGKSQLSKAEKKSLLNDVFPFGHVYILNTLNILVDRHRSFLMLEVLKGYRHLYNQHHSILEGIAYTVTPLSLSELHELETNLALKENCRVELSNRLDPRLIKGIKIRFNDKVIDASMKSRLENLRESLIEGRS